MIPSLFRRPLAVALLAALCLAAPAFAADPPAADPNAKSPFPYVLAKAFHILPETTTDESGYFALSEGLNGKVYVGTAAYGRNAYLVEFDPASEKQRVVVDTHKLVGLPLTPTGYASQAKIHTRNFVGKSGVIYLGSKQGYRLTKDDTSEYPGGYVMTYDPASDKAENLGMPYAREGVIDVVADEDRGLIYVVTCEDQHWLVYDVKTKKYKEIYDFLRLTPYATTLIEPTGRADTLTRDFKLARYNPETGQLTQQELRLPDGQAFDWPANHGPPTWNLAADGKTAYLVVMTRPNLYRIDLSGSDQGPVTVTDLGLLLPGKGHDTRCALTIAGDGRVYVLMRVDNQTGFGTGYLHHLTRYDPKGDTIQDLGVLVVKNPDFYEWTGPDGKPKKFSHGYHRLPDGALTPMHAHMGLIAAHDGRLYATILYPYTLLQIEPIP